MKKIVVKFQNGNCEVGLGGSLGIQVVLAPAPCKSARRGGTRVFRLDTIANEYVFDTTHKSGNFYYAWPELTYSPLTWFRVGVVAERTKAFHTSLDVQRGLLVGVSHKKWEFTTYIFNAGFTDPTVVLEAGVNF